MKEDARKPSGMMETFCILPEEIVMWVDIFIKAHQIVHLIYVFC